MRVVSSGLDLILSIPLLGVNITFGATGFGINLPFQHFGNNTQGHCGKSATPRFSVWMVTSKCGWYKRVLFLCIADLNYSKLILTKEHATTIRLMTAWYLEESWWTIVQWWQITGQPVVWMVKFALHQLHHLPLGIANLHLSHAQFILTATFLIASEWILCGVFIINFNIRSFQSDIYYLCLSQVVQSMPSPSVPQKLHFRMWIWQLSYEQPCRGVYQSADLRKVLLSIRDLHKLEELH